MTAVDGPLARFPAVIGKLPAGLVDHCAALFAAAASASGV